MGGYKFLKLMSQKLALRLYGYLLHFLHLIFGKKQVLQLRPKLPRFVPKQLGILGVKKVNIPKYRSCSIQTIVLS
jgi:hypothetical protein